MTSPLILIGGMSILAYLIVTAIVADRSRPPAKPQQRPQEPPRQPARSTQAGSIAQPQITERAALMAIAEMLPREEMWESAADFMEATCLLVDQAGIPRPDYYPKEYR